MLQVDDKIDQLKIKELFATDLEAGAGGGSRDADGTGSTGRALGHLILEITNNITKRNISVFHYCFMLKH